MNKKSESNTVIIEPIKTKRAKLRIVGDSPLITHCWDAKAQRDILAKKIGISKLTKMKCDPFAEFASSLYWLDKMPEPITKEALDEAFEKGARFGFPLTGIKQAAISAAYRMGWSKDKVSLRGAFFIDADENGYYGDDLLIADDEKSIDIIPNVSHSMPMVEIHHESLTMRRDMVRVGMGSADIRYRGEFANWYADITVCFNENGERNLDQIISMINAGGYMCGIGEWRPEKDGQYGMFHVQAS
jgi:hypothetical protein